MKERTAREIMSNYPYPVASSFVRLRTDECLDPGPLRLKYILATAEAVARFFGIITLCECREYIERTNTTSPKSLGNDFAQMFRRPSWGSWMHISREGLKWLRSEEETLCCTELTGFYLDDKGKESESIQALGKLLTVRNQLSHDKIKAMLPHHFSELCEQTGPLLDEVLEAMAFLLDYELTYISQIEVQKRRKHEANFLHRLKVINGHSDDFHGGRNQLHTYMDSSSMVLRNIDSSEYLNIDPLLIYEDAAGKAPDIFFYNGMKKPESAEYAACKHGGGFNSADAVHCADIAEELAAFLGYFSGSEGTADVA